MIMVDMDAFMLNMDTFIVKESLLQVEQVICDVLAIAAATPCV